MANVTRPRYKKTKVGWIPDEWDCVTIRDVAKVVTGSTPSTKNQKYYGSEFLFVGPTDLDNGKYVVDSLKKLSMDGFNICRKIPAGSTLFTCIGSTIGKIAIAGKEITTNQQINAAIPKNMDAREFLYYALLKLSPRIKSLASEQAVPIVNKSEFSAYKIPLPPLPEQKKIAEILSTWDEAIELTRRLIDAKKQRGKVLMQQLLTGKKRLPDFAKTIGQKSYRFFNLPEDWACPQIREIAQECSERNTGSNGFPVFACSKHLGFVKSSEYFGKRVFSEDTSNYKLIRQGWFGYPANHIEEGSIGLLLKNEIGLVSPIYIVFRCNENIVPEYLYAVFKTDTFRHIFAVSTNASVDRRGSLRWREFSLIRVPQPSPKEQRSIVNVLQAAEDEINFLETKLNALEKQKRGLMQKLLTGEIRVKT